MSTINPATGRKIKINGPMYRRLSKIYYTTSDGQLTDQIKPSLKEYSESNHFFTQAYNKFNIPNPNKKHRNMVMNPITNKKIVIGSKTWNDVYNQFEWNGKSFTNRRTSPLFEYEKTVKQRREFRKHIINMTSTITNVERVIDKSKLGYSVVYYNTPNVVKSEIFKASPKYRKVFNHTEIGRDHGVIVDGHVEFVTPLNYILNSEHRETYKQRLVEFIKKGMNGYSRMFISLKSIERFVKTTKNKETTETTYMIKPISDDRKVGDRIINKDHEEEYVNGLLNRLAIVIEGIELSESGWVFNGNIGVEFTLTPIKLHVGAGIKTPIPVFGESLINPCIDDNKCFQRCLILSYNGQSIIKNAAVCKYKIYSKYWNKPAKNPIDGHSMLDIEKVFDLQNDKPFNPTFENFRKVEEYFNIYVNCWEFAMHNDFDPKKGIEDNIDNFTFTKMYPINDDDRVDIKKELNLCILADPEKNIKHFTLIKDPVKFRKHIMFNNQTKTRHANKLHKCRFCDKCVGCKKLVFVHECKCHPECVSDAERFELDNNNTRLKFSHMKYAMPSPIVIYADFESSINNNKEHNPIMLSIALISRVNGIKNEYRVFHGANESCNDFINFIEYLREKYEKMVDIVFDEEKMRLTARDLADYNNTNKCPFCKIIIGEKIPGSKDPYKVKHHAHIAGEYSNGSETKFYNAGDYICTCCNKCNLQLSWTKRSIKLPVYFHNGSRYDNVFIMKILGAYKAKYPNSPITEIIPTSEDKEMLIEFAGIQFKDSYRMISAPLKSIVQQILGNDISNYKHTSALMAEYFKNNGMVWKNEYIDLMTRKEPMFYSAVKSYACLSNTSIPTKKQCYDELSNSDMSDSDYNHLKLLWNTFNIKSWGSYYELYNMLDVTLLADAFEHFRDSTYSQFGVDASHYLTTAQMSYSMFLKNISNNDLNRFDELSVKWAKYQEKINKCEGNSVEKMEEIYKKRMNEFYQHGGVKLMQQSQIDNFMKLNNNLRGGLTQITQRHCEKSDDGSSIFYLDANNLYGGAMHRMMPYEIVDIDDKELSKIQKQDPEKWIKSLKTYDHFGYFIECDIELPEHLHDYFNDLPLFPEQMYGQYSDYMKSFADMFAIDDLNNKKENVRKLVCTLNNKKNYVAHYTMIQLGLELGYRVTRINSVIKFRQAPFIYEYVSMLSEQRAKSKSSVLKNLYKLLANSIYGKFVETGLKRVNIKVANTQTEQNSIMNKYTMEMIENAHLYDDNIWVAKISRAKKSMTKPFYIGSAILDMSKYIVYDFFYNVLKKNFTSVDLLGQDTDSLIVNIKSNNVAEKFCELYKSFDFSEIDTTSYFYGVLVNYYNTKVNKDEFPTIESFVNYNKKVPGPIFKDEHNGHRILEFAGLRPKMYCLVDEKDIIHNACKGVPRTIIDKNKNNISVKNMNVYKRALFPTNSEDARLVASFNRIKNQSMRIESVSQEKVMISAVDNKRYVCEDNIRTYAWGHKDIPVGENNEFKKRNNILMN